MKKFVKAALAVISAAVLSLTMCISVSAKNIFDDSTTIKSGYKYTKELDEGDSHMFKINVSKKGKLKINVTNDYNSDLLLHVYNSDGTLLEPTKKEAKSGKFTTRNNDAIGFDLDRNNGVFKGTVTYNVSAGTHYIVFSGVFPSSTSKYSFSISAPGGNTEKSTKTSSESSVSSSDATIMLNMSAGDKIDLSAMNGKETVTSAKWKSSNSKIAKVSSKGIITAVKEGDCTVTWTSGSTKFTLYINVE
ncbi:MAG: Ig-like domain-containing protein [Oscillospiraceae bacterium]|nr:Ig-like domain-containing protein [Oscillospiraceae bacterium]